MKGRARFATLALLVALGGAACDAPAGEEPPGEPPPQDGVFGRVAPAVGGIPSVVTLEPVDGAGAAAAAPTGSSPVVDQRGLQFTPSRLVVRVGETVRFTNSESITHNIQLRAAATDSTVLSEDTPPGESVSYVVEQPGGYDILCDIHPGMTGFLFATAAPWGVFAEQDGRFQIPSVPAGTYLLTVWSLDDAAGWHREVVVREGAATEVAPD